MLSVASVWAARRDSLLESAVGKGGAEEPSQWRDLANTTSARRPGQHQHPESGCSDTCLSAALVSVLAAPGSLRKGLLFIDTDTCT